MPPANSQDPHNPAPEVTPDDSWDDFEEIPDSTLPAQTILPARRSLANQPPVLTQAEVGLRIDSNPTRDSPNDTPHRLEVQEVNLAVVRLEQEVKSTFKADRQIAFQEKSETAIPDESPKGESHEWGVAQQIPKRWIFGMATAVVVIVITGLLLLPLINSWNAPRANSNAGALSIVEEEKIEGMEAMNLLLERQPEAIQIFRNYSQAAHPDDIIPLIVDGRTIRETVSKHWSSPNVPKDWAPDVECAWSVLEFGGKAYGLLEGRFPNQAPFMAYFYYQGDRLLLDWKATTAYGTAPFSQLSKGIGDGSEIRGVISSDEFYSAAWPEEDYQSYRLTMPNEDFTVWCYARRGGPAHSALTPLFSSGELTGEKQVDRKVTLSLTRGSAETLPNQWLIGDLLHIDWGTH